MIKSLGNLNKLGIIFIAPMIALFSLGLGLDHLTPSAALAANDEPVLTELTALYQTNPCDCAADTLNCADFSSQDEAQACYNLCQEKVGEDVHKLESKIIRNGLVCEALPDDPSFIPAIDPTQSITATVGATPTVEPKSEPPVATNLIFNGNFEFGFYQVPELGFEPPHVGNVPNDWNWYRNQAYGKYTIENNQRFGLVCQDDIELAQVISETRAAESQADSRFGPIPGLQDVTPNSALALHMQSTDEVDSRIGVYQTIKVVPGQSYRFSMSATIQVQGGARTADLRGGDGQLIPQAPNQTYELYFDHSGNTNWRAIPHEKWTILPIKEERLFFTEEETEKKGESALSEIEDYETIVTAQSDKMTIFLTAWRKWANWRTAIYTVDCVALRPIDSAGQPISVAAVTSLPLTTTSSVEAVTASVVQPGENQAAEQPQIETATLPQTGAPQNGATGASPAVEVITADQNQESQQDSPSTETIAAQPEAEAAAPATADDSITVEDSTSIIPFSGGILEGKGNSILIIVVSLLVTLGLIGAGVWNMRR